jgi:hypothetical protein
MKWIKIITCSKLAKGSVPGDNINTSGVTLEESLNILARSKVGGSINYKLFII